MRYGKARARISRYLSIFGHEMAEKLGSIGMRGFRGGTSGQDLCDLMETSDILFSEYQRNNDIVLLHEAIALAESAITEMTPFHPHRAVFLDKRRKMLRSRSEHTEDVVGCEMAGQRGTEEVDETPQDMTTYSAVCSSILDRWALLEPVPSQSGLLGPDLYERYKRLGNVADLNEAIIQMERAIEICLPGNPVLMDMLGRLSLMLFARFKRLGDMNDLELAAGMNEEIIRETSPGDPSHIDALGDLGRILMRRFERVGDIGDLQKAVGHGEAALAATPHDDPSRAARHLNLGAILLTRFERIGDLCDLQKSINHSEEALAAAPPDFSGLADAQSNLAAGFIRRFRWIGDIRDLEKAIEHSRDALASTPPDHPHREGMHNNLGASLAIRFRRIGELGDLEEAIQYSEQALAAIPHNHPDRVSRQTNLGTLLSLRFEHMGDLDDLENSINHGEDALADASQDHPQRALLCANIAAKLSMKFERTGDLRDLQKSIKHTEEALVATPRDHPERAARKSSLGSGFALRFKRKGDIQDLQIAIKHGEEALDATPRDHPGRAAVCNNLGAKLFMRFERMGDLGDLQSAIMHSVEAVDATPLDHPDLGNRHGNLGNGFFRKFERTGDLDDLQKAIKHSEQARDATPRSHPWRSSACLSLAQYLELRSKIPSWSEDLGESLRLYQEACDCQTSPPRVRISAGRRAASLLFSTGRFHESSTMLERAVNLMPSVNLRLLNRDDQQHMLSELWGLSSAAASMALYAGREAYHSLQLLELGRGIIMGFTIDSRSEFSELEKDHPFEFHKFHRLRAEIDSPIDEINGTSFEPPDQARNRVVSRRWDAVKEMEAILNHIRTFPGYDGFLLPPPPEDLMKLAAHGPLVLFNCTPYRSDAITVTTSAITSLELPKLKYKETSRWMTQLASFGGGGWIKRGQDNRKMKDLLIWLWDAAVGPVFDHLERSGTIIYDGNSNTNLKRVWWIGVGQLSMAPFHAAGDHALGSTRNTLSRAISTYIPTVKALSYARQAQPPQSGGCVAPNSVGPSKGSQILETRNPTLLVVPMAKTPGAADLPGVNSEVQYIHDSAAPKSVETMVLSNPTPAKILKQLVQHDIVHFACHGVSDTNPSDSHLILLTPDGNDAGKLMVRDISNIAAQNAQLAYLSACSSAKNPSSKLADEVIHLASAFQLAGFSHTLANLWETDDQASSEVARDFYNLLFQHQENGDWRQRIPTAFHQAVKNCRDKQPGNFLTWAPFVHTGA